MCGFFLPRIVVMDHDQHFKNLILDYPREAIALFAEAEAREIDATVRVTPVRQEQLKARLGDRHRETDIPLLLEWPDGRRQAILFVIEEETEPRRFSVHRLVHYCLDLAQLCDTERVVPVVVFLHPGAFETRLELGSEHRTFLRFEFLPFSLASAPAAAYMNSDNLVARVNLPNMAYPPEAKVDVYEQAVRGLLMLEADVDRQEKYADFIDMYAELDENEWVIYRARHAKEDDMVVSSKQKFREEGRQEGTHDGAARVLLRQLALRFGEEASVGARSQVEAADLEEIMAWSDRILTATSLEDVFAEQ